MFVCDIRDIRTNIQKIYDLLPLCRRQRFDRLRVEDERLRCAAAGFLLREVLAVDEDRDITRDENEKPHIRPGAVPEDCREISVSHGGSYAVLLTSAYSCGVDVERIEDFHESIIGRCYTEDERKWIEEGGGEARNERAYAVWTMKESIMKADGRGLGLDPRSFSVFDGKWHVSHMMYDGHMFAWACADRDLSPQKIIPVRPGDI